MKAVSLILAAGEAKRFGYPKQILKWGSSTILGTVIENSLNAHFYKVYVVLGAHYEKITKTIPDILKKVTVVHNKEWKEGMFSSIKAGLRKIKEDNNIDYVLIQLGDMPFINSIILSKFLETIKDSPHVVIATESNRPGHPYMFHKKFIDEILNSEFPEGMRSFIKREFANALKIEVEKIAARQDIDTWDNYVQFHSNSLHY